MSDTWNTTDMKSALPADDNTIMPSNGITDDNNSQPTAQPAAEGEWCHRKPYDYAAHAETWAGNAPVYEFDPNELGEVGPIHPGLEVELFGAPENRSLNNTGIAFDTIDSISVDQRGETQIIPIRTFDEAGLHPAMRRNVELAGYHAPTPIQRYTFPAIRDGLDLVAIAQTGSGKTASYLIPILSKLMGKAKKLAAARPNPLDFIPGVTQMVRAEPLVVVVCPTRELAVQIFNEARKFCYRTMLRPCVTYGGGSLRDQIEQLGRGCDVLIASPGRLCDFIERPHVLSLRRMRYLVLDEADELLTDGWAENIESIMTGGEQEEGNVKYMLFSATFPKNLRDLARTHLATSHSQISVGRIGSSHANILQRVAEVQPENKREMLKEYLNSLPAGRTIIFVNAKRTADEVDDFLYNSNFPCTSMHADRTQLEREAAMRAFRAGNCPILVATGVSARGIDVQNVMHVINYDLPSMDHGGIEEYTHRIGRTGRIGHKGLATSFYDAERDAAISSVLCRTLLETEQEVPGFLQQYMPEGDDLKNLKWETNSNPEDRPADSGDGGYGDGGYGDDAGDGAGGGGWGEDGGAAGNDAGGWNSGSAEEQTKASGGGGW